MTELMEKALRQLPGLSDDDQAIVAEFILGNTGKPLKLSAAEKKAIDVGFADSSKGIYAPESALQDTLARLRDA